MYLFDEKGYEIKIDISKTVNLAKEGISADGRELAVFFRYIGPNIPVKSEKVYTNDSYVISRLEFPWTDGWDRPAIKGFNGPEPEGTWAQKENQVNIKDSDLGKNGFRISYFVPDFIVGRNAMMRITVNGVLKYETSLEKSGEYTEIIDISDVGIEEQEYIVKAQRILKTTLIEFDRVCSKYNLKYYLICGSLLGAVRHKDLVPWDDDVDVAMPRKDFDKLLKVAKSEWNENSKFILLDYDDMGNRTFLDFMTRLVYMEEEIPVNIYRKIRGKGRTDVDNHLPIDIYVLDNASDNLRFHNFQTLLIQGLYGLAMGHRAYIKESDYYNRDERTQKKVKVVSTIGRMIPLACIFGMYEWVRKWNNNKKTGCFFESNGFVYCIPWRFEQKWFEDGKRLNLGTISVCVPKDYDAFLKVHYGDYMQYPPMEARIPTHSENATGVY